MTRTFALFLAAAALAVTACERHPLPGQSAVTFTHGSGGGDHGHGHGDSHGHGAADSHAADKHAEATHVEAKPQEAKKPEHAAGSAEEAPKFFPEKK